MLDWGGGGDEVRIYKINTKKLPLRGLCFRWTYVAMTRTR
jgi:hypothetical protein